MKANRVDLRDAGSVSRETGLRTGRRFCSGKPQIAGMEVEVPAHFAGMMRPEPRSLPDAASRELSALITPHQLIEIMTAESNRRDRAPKTNIDQRAPASAPRSSLLRLTERSAESFPRPSLAAKG